jgi:hypothetical protein
MYATLRKKKSCVSMFEFPTRVWIQEVSLNYRVFSVQADWTLTHTSHKDTERSTIEASITLDGVTLTDPLIRWSPNEWP